MNKPLQLSFGWRLCCFTVHLSAVQVKVCSQYLNLKYTYSVICFASQTVFKALHLGERMECADKTRFLPLYPVYRIMHSIPGSSAARLSNLMSSCSKWNVSGSCQDESFSLSARRFDHMAAKILVMYIDGLGRRQIPWRRPLNRCYIKQAMCYLNLVLPASHVSSFQSQGESEVSLRGVISARGASVCLWGVEDTSSFQRADTS